MFEDNEETIQSLKIFENSSTEIVKRCVKELRLLEIIGKTGKTRKVQYLSEEAYGAIE